MKNKRNVIIILITLFLLSVIAVSIYIVATRSTPRTDNTQTEITRPASYTIEDVAAHNTADDCWTVINGSVYDLSNFINRHPGGSEIVRACGIDATTLFESRRTADGQIVGSGTPHSNVAQDQLEDLKIGELK